MKKIVVAIDGFSSCGKSTLAKALAKEVGYAYVDTGAMYRSVALYCLRNGLISDGKVDEEKLAEAMPSIQISFQYNSETQRNETYLNGENVEEEIRSLAVSNVVSIVSAIGFVRRAMVAQQQSFSKEKGVVMDGRDIGTVVFPDAELKVFVTARPEVRAQRRFLELSAKGDSATFEEVLENVKQRDFLDQNREESPLRQAEDAILLDNSEMTIPQQNEWLLARFNDTVKNL
jgi:cytidylate kinase